MSFISDNFRMLVPALHKRPLAADFIAARAVNGQMLDTLGTITATLRLGKTSRQHVFHVLRESTQTAQLGLDFFVYYFLFMIMPVANCTYGTLYFHF